VIPQLISVTFEYLVGQAVLLHNDVKQFIHYDVSLLYIELKLNKFLFNLKAPLGIGQASSVFREKSVNYLVSLFNTNSQKTIEVFRNINLLA